MKGQLNEKSLMRKILSELRSDFPIDDEICQIGEHKKVNVNFGKDLIKMKIAEHIRLEYALNEVELEYVIDEYFNECLVNC